MNWIEKWLVSFRMGTTSSTTMQSLGEIEQHVPAIGAKMWCLYVCYRQDCAKCNLPVLNLLTGWKSGFSPRRGDSLYRFSSNLAQPRGTWARLAVQNFTPIGARGWECGPKMANISTFW